MMGVTLAHGRPGFGAVRVLALDLPPQATGLAQRRRHLLARLLGGFGRHLQLLTGASALDHDLERP